MELIICGNLITKGGRYLLVKETKKGKKGLYNFPSGHLERNENLPKAAIREAREETGLKIKPVKLISVFDHFLLETGVHAVIFIFESKIIGGRITTSAQHPEVKFFSLREIRKLEKAGLLRGAHILRSIGHRSQNIAVSVRIIETLWS